MLGKKWVIPQICVVKATQRVPGMLKHYDDPLLQIRGQMNSRI